MQIDSICIGEKKNMATKNKLVPEAKEALNKFKMEAASEVGVNLKNGYNGDLTSRQAGSVGGQMVNDMNRIRTFYCTRTSRKNKGHLLKVKLCYILTL